MLASKKNYENISDFIADQSQLDTLRFITCGSVDDGKSTLIGRMLYEGNLVHEDQIDALRAMSGDRFSSERGVDFSLLLDGLSAEREQGITIDVAYRYFSTDYRKFVVADTPGHEQYTRNMVTGASNSDLAVILIDSRRGVLSQTRRHMMICTLLGIKRFVVAINKIDLVNYDKSTFLKISRDVDEVAKTIGVDSVVHIPISALEGDNVVTKSIKTPWFSGPTLLGYLNSVEIREITFNDELRFPIQMVNRPHQDFRGVSGTIVRGRLSLGVDVMVMPSGVPTRIKRILSSGEEASEAQAGEAVTVLLEDDIDVSRGDVIISADGSCNVSDHFETMLVWLDDEPGFMGRTFLMKLGSTVVNARIATVKYKLSIADSSKSPVKKLEANDISCVTVMVDKPIAFDKFDVCPAMGGFILIDRFSFRTIAAGMIKFGLRRSDNIHWQDLEINKLMRRDLNGHGSKVVWLTGISGSGKSTIANQVEKKLYSLGLRTYVLDGDNVRRGLNSDLGFTDSDRVENSRRLAQLAKILVDAGLFVIVASISPFKAERRAARELFESGEFIEVFVDTPLAIAEERDPKGLYRKARLGEIPNFTGIGSTYERPLSPELTVYTETEPLEKIVDEMVLLITQE